MTMKLGKAEMDMQSFTKYMGTESFEGWPEFQYVLKGERALIPSNSVMVY